MKRKMLWGSFVAAVVALALAAYFVAGPGIAQVKVKEGLQAPKIDKPIPQMCMKPDLTQWKDNLPFMPKGEFPFEGPCKSCLLKLGAMYLPHMGTWITNKGMTDAPASKAKLTWKSAKAPYTNQTIVANVPAIAAGGQFLLEVVVPQDTFFQISAPVTLELDSAKTISECNENNNNMTYSYH
ncbi:MAG TPA: CARDB domain-containing protein [bacterium]|nr:CARDB domain-containing protein [bacterium]